MKLEIVETTAGTFDVVGGHDILVAGIALGTAIAFCHIHYPGHEIDLVVGPLRYRDQFRDAS